MELEAYGRVLRSNWHFRNDEKEFDRDKFKPKPTFSTRNNDAAIERFFIYLEEKLKNTESKANTTTLLGKIRVHLITQKMA